MPIINPADNFPLSKGASFPTTPNSNDLFYRTDRAILYYYDGTRWLSVNEYTQSFSTYGQFWSAITGTTTPAIVGFPDTYGVAAGIYMTKWTMWTSQASGNPAAFWTFSLTNDALTVISSFTTASDGAVKTEHTATINSVRTRATDKYWYIGIAATGAPGTTSILGTHISYRLIG